MKLKSLVAAAVLGTAALSSFATTTHETLQFTYSGTGQITGFSGTLSSLGKVDTFSSVMLDGQAFGSSVLGGKVWSINSNNTANHHLLSFDYTGTATPVTTTFGFLASNGGASTKNLINTQVAAVPEPETYAMMLAGLGALGFLGRRRKAQ